MNKSLPKFVYHSIEETYGSGWIPTSMVEDWKQKMTESVIALAKEKEREGYKVSFHFDERDADYHNDEEISKMVLTIEIYKEYE